MREPKRTGPVTAADRKRSSIPLRFATWESYRAYMNGYMSARRAARRTDSPATRLALATPGTPEQIAASIAVSVAANKRRARRGFCALCGHRSPVSTCPVCYVEQTGRHASDEPIAWDALIGAAK